MQSTITLPDKTAFQWLLLNLLCHDFQHDYSEPGKRTSKLKGQIVAEVDLLLSNYYVLKNGEDDAEKFQEFQEDFEQVEGHAFKGGGKENKNERTAENAAMELTKMLGNYEDRLSNQTFLDYLTKVAEDILVYDDGDEDGDEYSAEDSAVNNDVNIDGGEETVEDVIYSNPTKQEEDEAAESMIAISSSSETALISTQSELHNQFLLTSYTLNKLEPIMKKIIIDSRYCLKLISKDASNGNKIPMISTMQSSQKESKAELKEKNIGYDYDGPTLIMAEDEHEYDSKLKEGYKPLLNISDPLPTCSEIIKHGNRKIKARIEELAPQAAESMGAISLAPILRNIIRLSRLSYSTENESETNGAVMGLFNETSTILDDTYNVEDGNIYINLSTTFPYSSRTDKSKIKVENPYLEKFLLTFLKTMNDDKITIIKDKKSIDNFKDKLKGGIEAGKKKIEKYIITKLNTAGKEELTPFDNDDKLSKIRYLNLLIPHSLRIGIDLLLINKDVDDEIKTILKELPVPLTSINVTDKNLLKGWTRFLILLYDYEQRIKSTSSLYDETDELKQIKEISDWVLDKISNKNHGHISLQNSIPRPTTERSSVVWSELQGKPGLEKIMNGLSGGLYFQKGGGKEEWPALTSLNNVLLRSIQFVILERCEAIKSTEDIKPMYPIFPITKGGEPLVGNQIENYKYYKPSFTNIFDVGGTFGAWETIQFRKDNIILKGELQIASAVTRPIVATKSDSHEKTITWDYIYGSASGSPTDYPLNLTLRKKMARQLFLNVQILVLYYQLIVDSVKYTDQNTELDKGLINKPYFLQSLGFIVDKKPNLHWSEIERRGFTTDGYILASHGKDKETKNKKLGTWREVSDTTYQKQDDRHYNCVIKRQQYFGWLFGDNIYYKTDPKRKKIYATPSWFAATSPDEQIQLAYYEIVRKLLPEYILTAAGRENTEWLESEVKLPVPLECSPQKIDESGKCETWTAVGDVSGTEQMSKGAYIINNASQIYPQIPKLNEDPSRWEFLNLSGLQARAAQYCPISSVADSQSLCVIGGDTSVNTQSRMVSNNMDVKVTFNEGENSHFYNLRIRPTKKLSDLASQQTYNEMGELATFLLITEWDFTTDSISEHDRLFAILDKPSLTTVKATWEREDGFAKISGPASKRGSHTSVKNKQQVKKLLKVIQKELSIKQKEFMEIRVEACVKYNDHTLRVNPTNTVINLIDSPFEAATSYLNILTGINSIIIDDNQDNEEEEEPSSRGLWKYFTDNIDMIFDKSIRKSLGDYSQELVSLAKNGGDNPDQFNTANQIILTDTEIKKVPNIALPYDAKGDSFRLFVANDRPSALRSIFFITQCDNDKINAKAMGGYYRLKWHNYKDPSKETINSEKEGKTFIVKGDYVIRSQLPEYFLDKWGSDDNRAQRVGLIGNVPDAPFTGKDFVSTNNAEQKNKPVYGYNEDDAMRWMESMYKLSTTKEEERPGSTTTNTTGGVDGDGFGNNSNSNNSNSNNSDNENTATPPPVEEITLLQKLKDRNYQVQLGGKKRKSIKRKSKKRKFFIKHNKTSKIKLF